MSTRRISDRAVEQIELTLGIYAEEGLIFELIPFPYPNPQNPAMMHFGITLGVMMPTPSLAKGEYFFVSGQWPSALIFETIENTRQIIHDFVELLRKQKADWLRGTQ